MESKINLICGIIGVVLGIFGMFFNREGWEWLAYANLGMGISNLLIFIAINMIWKD